MIKTYFMEFYKKIAPALNVKYYKDPQKIGGMFNTLYIPKPTKKLSLDHIKVKIHKDLHGDLKLNKGLKKGGGGCIIA